MKYLSLFILILYLASCDKNEENFTLQIGENYVDSTTKVYFIDTLTVKAATIQFDSLIVNNVNRLLIGSYNDSVFGKTKSKSFVQLQNSIYDIDDDAVYDSIALILKYDKYFYNDTIPTQRFKIFELLDDIEPNEDDGFYYNTTNFNTHINAIAEKDFLAKPNKNDSLNININDIFGATLFNKIKDDIINNNDEFLDEYKGLLIEADQNISTSVLGFTKNSLLRMYYVIDDGDDILEKTIDFTFNSFNTFNQTVSDKTGTYFEDIIDQETILPSLETDDSCFMQSGTGLVTRIDIPYINSLNEISREGSIISAKLKFSLKRNTFSDNLFVRDLLQVYILNIHNDVLQNLGGDAPISSIIINDDPEFETDIYEIDIKQFITLKQSETFEKYYLAIYPQDFNSSVDRYIFNGENTSSDLQMKLELTYAVYDE